MRSRLTERWAPAIWVGYNTMKFDEEVLRQTFYQNLSPNIYATQFNGNTRFDILPAVYAAYARHPDLLVWPTDDTGRRSFKLDRLPNFDTWSPKSIDFRGMAPMISIGWARRRQKLCSYMRDR